MRKVLLETTNEDKTFGFERLENDTEYRVGKNLDDPKIVSVVLKHGLGIGFQMNRANKYIYFFKTQNIQYSIDCPKSQKWQNIH